VLLWVSGESLQAAFENVIVAEYRCRYDWQDRKVKDIHGGVFYPTRFASPQWNPPSHDHATGATLRVSVHWARSASFPTGGKGIMTRFVEATPQ
jgi:hypothetical protein